MSLHAYNTLIIGQLPGISADELLANTKRFFDALTGDWTEPGHPGNPALPAHPNRIRNPVTDPSILSILEEIANDYRVPYQMVLDLAEHFSLCSLGSDFPQVYLSNILPELVRNALVPRPPARPADSTPFTSREEADAVAHLSRHTWPDGSELSASRIRQIMDLAKDAALTTGQSLGACVLQAIKLRGLVPIPAEPRSAPAESPSDFRSGGWRPGDPGGAVPPARPADSIRGRRVDDPCIDETTEFDRTGSTPAPDESDLTDDDLTFELARLAGHERAPYVKLDELAREMREQIPQASNRYILAEITRTAGSL